MINLAKRSIRSWLSWRARRRLYRTYPELIHFDQAEAAAKRSHGRTKHIQKAREAFMRAALAGGLDANR